MNNLKGSVMHDIHPGNKVAKVRPDGIMKSFHFLSYHLFIFIYISDEKLRDEKGETHHFLDSWKYARFE